MGERCSDFRIFGFDQLQDQFVAVVLIRSSYAMFRMGQN